ncbi:Clr5 domain-containing protein [Podospora conica]|nr:Clr5 domain-containing protein [Schizothecium conicum]
MTKSWEEHKEVIIEQYKEHNKPLHEVQRFMEDRHGFKASTRAYRSRFDKWGVHKYSCRKRKGSEAEHGHSEYDDNDHRTTPEMHSPDSERRDYGYMDDADSSPSSSISPSSSTHDRHYYGAMGGATPPSELGSPITSKFETYHHHHHQHAPLTPPSFHHPMTPTQGYLASPQQYSYQQPYSHYGTTQPAAASESYYHRTSGPQDHLYPHLQAPGMDLQYGGYSHGGDRRGLD